MQERILKMQEKPRTEQEIGDEALVMSYLDILQTRLYKHNVLTPDDYKDMLKDANALYNTACEIVDYIQEESYPE